MTGTGWMVTSMRQALLAAFVVALPWGAHATPADTYGALARGVATAGAQTASADDAGAAYYNPAGFGLGAASGKVSFSLGYSAGAPSLRVDRTRTEGAVRYPTQDPPYRGWETLGLMVPLGGKLQHKVALGMLLYHPQDKLVRVQAFSPRYPQWLRYQSGTDRMELDIGFGAKLGRYVSVGAGVHVLAGLEGVVDFDMDLFERRIEKRDLTFDLITRVSPTLGVIVTPAEKLRVGLSFRGSNQLDVSQPNVIGLGDVGTLDLIVEGTVHFTPQQFAAGVSYEVRERLKLNVDLRAHRWSQAPHPAVQVKVGIKGEVPEGLGLDEVLTFQTNDPDPGFVTIVVPSFAAEYTFPDKVTQVRGGYAFRPSYVPDQTGRSNFLDTNTHLLGLGATFQFQDPSGVFTQPLKFDLAAQGQLLQTRFADKPDGDLVGDFSYGGFAFAASAALRYEF